MIYLARHGETDWNLFKRFNGVTDTCLNQTGIEQAKFQAENLNKIDFAVCFCSTQTRARQFCEVIYKGEIIFDVRLAEINCGEFEGTQETAESMQSFLHAAANGDRGTEKIEDFIKRNCDLCDVIAKEHKGKNVLIVTHAVNTRVINYYFTGSPKDYDFSNRVVDKGEFIILNN